MRKSNLVIVLATSVALLLVAWIGAVRSNRSEMDAAVERDARIDPDAARTQALNLPRSNVGAIPVDTTLGEWRPLGPRNFAGKVYDVAVSRYAPDTLYACYGRGGVWRFAAGSPPLNISQMGGANRSWNQVAVWAGDDKTVVIGTGSLWNNSGVDLSTSILLSHDGGETWNDITPPSAGDNQITALQIDPTDWHRIYALGNFDLFRTDDGGSNWRTLHTLDVSDIPVNDDRWPDLAVNPSRFDDVILGQIGIGVLKSTDGGAHWHDVGTQIVPRMVPAFAWSHSSPNVVWLETWSSATGQLHDIWRSTDYGENWTRRTSLTAFTQGRYDMSIDVSPVDPDSVIAANSGYHYSSDAMQTNVGAYCCGHVDHSSVAYAPSDATQVYVGSDQGLFLSTGGGTTAYGYARYDAGVLTTTHVFSFDVSSMAGQRLILANAGDYYNFLGDISGSPQDWSANSGYEYMTVAASPVDPMLMITVGGGQPLLRSIDRGATWQNVEFLGTISREYAAPVAFDHGNANAVFVADKQVWRSDQKGAVGTWASIGPSTTMTGNVNLRKVAVAPNNSQVIYTSADFSSSIIYFTKNGGTNWSSFDSGVAYILDIAINPADASKLIVSGPFNLRYCSMYGGSCAENRANLAPPADVRLNRISFDPADAGRLYGLAESGGAFVSKNSGASWQRIGNMLPTANGSEMRFVDGRLYASNDQGVWELRSDQYGQPGVPSPSVTRNTNGGLRISWRAVSGAVSYIAQRVGGAQVYSGFNNTFADMLAPVGVQICYRVAAQNADGISAFSGQACGTAVDTIFWNGFD